MESLEKEQQNRIPTSSVNFLEALPDVVFDAVMEYLPGGIIESTVRQLSKNCYERGRAAQSKTSSLFISISFILRKQAQQKEVVLSDKIKNATLLKEVQQKLYEYGHGYIVVGDPYSTSATSKVTTALAIQAFNRKVLSRGLLVGPPYGGAMYDIFHGKEACFLILAGLGVIGAGLQLLVLPPKLQFQEQVSDSTSLRRLLMDPRIVIAAASIVVGNLGLGVLIPGLQLLMVDKWNSTAFQLGIIFFPCSLAYLIGTTFVPALALKFGRWRCVLIALPTISICLVSISLAPAMYWLYLPITIIGMCISFIDSAMIPLLGQMAYLKHKAEERLTEIGHFTEASPLLSARKESEVDSEDSQISSTYAANAYAISDAGLSIAYWVAPMASGPLVQWIGFKWMTWAFAIGIVCFAPLAIFLRNPTGSSRIRGDSILPNRH
ncbi:unnamed protein product, partial [Mesorhabditis belari]|uniref:Uncharacterized protein n=1 Tax=Mesorhabditis belari TaxID=2138241 RepID=A0AAF3F9G8_9BILA